MRLLARCLCWTPTAAFVLALVYVTAYKPYENGPPIRSDGAGYHVWTYALKKWDFRFCEYWQRGETGSAYMPGRCLAKYPPGVALFRYPVMAWFVNVDRHTSFSPGEHWVSLIYGSAVTMVIYIIGLAVQRRVGLNLIDSQAVLFLLFFGTGLFHYGTYDSSFSHIYSAFGSAVLIWLLFIMQAHERAARRWEPILAGIAAFFMILFRNTNVLVLMAFMALVTLGSARWSSKRRVLAGVCAGSAAAAAVQLSYNHYVFGRLAMSSYGPEWFEWNRSMFPSVLFSYERGLFTYYPVMLFGLVIGLACGRSRKLASAALALVLLYAVIYGYWSSWYLGGGFGHRGFVDLVPWMIPVIALALTEMPSARIRRSILAAGALTVLVPLQVMLAYWRGTFPFNGANREIYWSHLVASGPGPYLFVAAVGCFVVAAMAASRLEAPRLQAN